MTLHDCREYGTATQPTAGGWIERGWRDAEGNNWVTTPDGARNLGPSPLLAYTPAQPRWYRPAAMTTREDLIARAKPEHDKACSCDPRYLLSCPKMAATILALAKERVRRR